MDQSTSNNNNRILPAKPEDLDQLFDNVVHFIDEDSKLIYNNKRNESQESFIYKSANIINKLLDKEEYRENLSVSQKVYLLGMAGVMLITRHGYNLNTSKSNKNQRQENNSNVKNAYEYIRVAIGLVPQEDIEKAEEFITYLKVHLPVEESIQRRHSNPADLNLVLKRAGKAISRLSLNLKNIKTVSPLRSQSARPASKKPEDLDDTYKNLQDLINNIYDENSDNFYNINGIIKNITTLLSLSYINSLNNAQKAYVVGNMGFMLKNGIGYEPDKETGESKINDAKKFYPNIETDLNVFKDKMKVQTLFDNLIFLIRQDAEDINKTNTNTSAFIMESKDIIKNLYKEKYKKYLNSWKLAYLKGMLGVIIITKHGFKSNNNKTKNNNNTKKGYEYIDDALTLLNEQSVAKTVETTYREFKEYLQKYIDDKQHQNRVDKLTKEPTPLQTRSRPLVRKAKPFRAVLPPLPPPRSSQSTPHPLSHPTPTPPPRRFQVPPVYEEPVASDAPIYEELPEVRPTQETWVGGYRKKLTKISKNNSKKHNNKSKCKKSKTHKRKY